MENTEHLKLTLPDGNDYVNIETLNENWKKIDAAFPELHQLIEGRAQVVSGSYVGTGTHGAENPNTLDFPFMPKIVMVLRMINDFPDYFDILWLVNPLEYSSWKNPHNTSAGHAVEWDGDESVGIVSWWMKPTGTNASSGAADQRNVEGVTYHYIAIG